MKKARFILAAVAVMAVAGGVYASKANRGAQIFCTTTQNGTAYTLNNYTITAEGVGFTSYCTLVNLAKVPATTYITLRN